MHRLASGICLNNFHTETLEYKCLGLDWGFYGANGIYTSERGFMLKLLTAGADGEFGKNCTVRLFIVFDPVPRDAIFNSYLDIKNLMDLLILLFRLSSELKERSAPQPRRSNWGQTTTTHYKRRTSCVCGRVLLTV